MNSKRPYTRSNNYTQKQTQPVSKQLQSSSDNQRNKLMQQTPQQNSNLVNVSVNRKNNSKQIQFENNPVIVTRRNVSTAQTKNLNEHDEEEDLLETSNFARKKQATNYTSHFGQTVKQSFRKPNERAQSKQEGRNKGWTNSEMLIKSSVIPNDRPQTSKGQRPKQLQTQKSRVEESKRKMSLGNESKIISDQIFEIGNKNPIKTSKLFFKTSIDSQFLSLFAN